MNRDVQPGMLFTWGRVDDVRGYMLILGVDAAYATYYVAWRRHDDGLDDERRNRVNTTSLTTIRSFIDQEFWHLRRHI